MRTGIGYDVHAFAEGRRLIVGGVEIPHSKGLLGHSDADVLVHAIMDALLGAMGEPDIGTLFPDTDRLLDAGEESDWNHRFVEQALHNTDERLRNNLRVTPAFLLAALLWPPLVKRLEQLTADQGRNDAMVRQRAANDVINRTLQQIAIPRRFSTPMREIWDMQARLPRRHGTRADRLMEHPRFRAAYDFVLLRESAGEELDGLGVWWTRYQDADPQQRRDLVAQLDGSGKSPRRNRRPRRRKAPQQA